MGLGNYCGIWAWACNSRMICYVRRSLSLVCWYHCTKIFVCTMFAVRSWLPVWCFSLFLKPVCECVWYLSTKKKCTLYFSRICPTFILIMFSSVFFTSLGADHAEKNWRLWESTIIFHLKLPALLGSLELVLLYSFRTGNDKLVRNWWCPTIWYNLVPCLEHSPLLDDDDVSQDGCKHL